VERVPEDDIKDLEKLMMSHVMEGAEARREGRQGGREGQEGHGRHRGRQHRLLR
jgi:hypothetical protein